MKALFHSLGSLPWAQEPAIRADRIADALGVHGRVCLGWVVAVLELLEAGQHALVHPGLRARQINVLGRIAPQPATTTPSAFFLSDVQEARAGCRTRRGRGRASMRRRPCTAAACRWCRLRTSGHLLRQSLRRGRESCAQLTRRPVAVPRRLLRRADDQLVQLVPLGLHERTRRVARVVPRGEVGRLAGDALLRIDAGPRHAVHEVVEHRLCPRRDGRLAHDVVRLVDAVRRGGAGGVVRRQAGERGEGRPPLAAASLRLRKKAQRERRLHLRR